MIKSSMYLYYKQNQFHYFSLAYSIQRKIQHNSDQGFLHVKNYITLIAYLKKNSTASKQK